MQEFHPAEQGAYDHLCAIYAIINARRYLDGRIHDGDSVFDRPFVGLFRQLVAAALRDIPGYDLVTRGPHENQIASLLEVAGLDAPETADPDAIDRHLQGNPVIIHFAYDYEAERPDHYSLLFRDAGVERLFDSYQFALQSRNGLHLAFTPETELPQGATIRRAWLIGQPRLGGSVGSS